MKTKAFNLSRAMTGDGMVVSFYTKDTGAVESFFSKLPDEVEVEMSRPKQKRSLDANAYIWVLLDKLAAKLQTTAEELYKAFIERVGVFTFQLVQEDAADDFIVRWAINGLGCFCQNVGTRQVETVRKDGKKTTQNMAVLKVYYGSSQYTVEEMQRLINEVQEECKAQGIETKTPDELQELMERWKAYE